MLKNGTFTPSSTDAAMILTATNQRCCNELFGLHLSDVSCCFEVGKHLLASWQRLAAMSPPLAPYASLSPCSACGLLRRSTARHRQTRVRPPTPRLQPPILEAACNERNRYLCEKCKRKNNHSMGTPPPVGFAASERAGARAREQLVLKTSALWEKQTYKCRFETCERAERIG